MSQQKLYYDDCGFRIGRKLESVNQKRMYVSASASLPCGEADEYVRMPSEGFAGLGLNHTPTQRRFAVDVATQGRQQGRHLSIRAALLMVAVLAFLLCIASLSQKGMISEQQKLLNRNNREIQTCMSSIETLTAKIAEKSDEAAICYRASRDLGLIRSEAAEAIYLTAVSSRPIDQETADRELDAVAAKAAFSENLPEGQ